MEFVVVYDEFGIGHRLKPEDAQFPEARAAYDALGTSQPEGSNGNTPRVVWPLAKIVKSRGFGWWSVYESLHEYENDLKQQIPHPGEYRLLKLEGEYTPTELSDMLQHFGSYLATLHYLEGMLEAQCHALKEVFKTALQVSMASGESEAKTVAAREGEAIASNELLRETRRNQIEMEAKLLLLKGWREAYDIAWSTTSRIITLRGGELALQTGRHA